MLSGEKGKHNRKRNLLIIGVGNPLRGDDAVGNEVTARIAAEQIEGVFTMQVQQLTTDLLDEILQADATVVVDASLNTESVELYQASPAAPAGTGHSHAASVSLLQQLAKQLRGLEPVIYICGIGVGSLEFGETLSPVAKQNADLAVSTLFDWIREHEY